MVFIPKSWLLNSQWPYPINFFLGIVATNNGFYDNWSHLVCSTFSLIAWLLFRMTLITWIFFTEILDFLSNKTIYREMFRYNYEFLCAIDSYRMLSTVKFCHDIVFYLQKHEKDTTVTAFETQEKRHMFGRIPWRFQCSPFQGSFPSNIKYTDMNGKLHGYDSQISVCMELSRNHSWYPFKIYIDNDI